MSGNGRLRGDETLLTLAKDVLAEAGFALEIEADGEVLLAEDAYSIMGIGATPTVAELVSAESVVGDMLQRRLDSVEIGPKIWDAYIVLLTQDDPGDDRAGLRKLFDINYDTRAFRRMARSGVEATERGIRKALAPFMEPTDLGEVGLSTDPLDDLSRALVEHGVERSTAQRAIEIYRAGGSLDDAL